MERQNNKKNFYDAIKPINFWDVKKWKNRKIKDGRKIKNKIRTYGGKVDTNFRGLSVPEDDTEYESFTAISINSLLVYENRYYLQVHLDNCTYRIANKQTTDYLDDNLF